jgi:hypothetical protein
MPLQCRYCGMIFWTALDETAHATPCRPGAAPGSTTIGVPPGMTTAPDPVGGDAVLPADAAGTGLQETAAP